MAKAQAQEPSMEEILASIRRIIADEDTAPKEKVTPAPEPAEDETISEEDLDKLFASADKVEESEDEEDVLDLTEDLAEDAEPADEPSLVEGLVEASDVTFAEDAGEPESDSAPDDFEPAPEPEPEPAPVVVAPPPPKREPVFVAPPAPAPEPPPVRPAPVFAAAPAPEPTPEPRPLLSESTEGLVANAFNDLALTVLNRNARTLEDLVQEMLRPMLKSWLDQNLPTMVERMVRAEIERVTRGR